jgi:lycopene cyclase domain-containing protein
VSVLYLLALLVALACLVLVDRRFRLYFWHDAARAAVVLAVGVLFFVLWDLCGIGLGIFRRGETPYLTGLVVAPQLPVEEIFFLTFLCYLTMLLVLGFVRMLITRRQGRP